MQCQDHPNVAAIEDCALCKKPMCGMCANYLDDGVYCEKCVAIQETEKFVESQTQQHEKSESSIQIEKADSEGRFAKPEKKSNAKNIQIGIIAISFAVMGFQFYRSSNDSFVPIDPETRARELAISSFAQCLILFREIGTVLANGDMPGDSMRCDESGAANIIEEINGDVRVSHPHPDFYGYSQIYVSRSNPEPTLVE
ncbi:MAG: hypothetical protein GKR91_15110 [Pseudomonadales bacterium]|nr:hypothetical protein [Pseudomonadales bacterium]